VGKFKLEKEEAICVDGIGGANNKRNTPVKNIADPVCNRYRHWKGPIPVLTLVGVCEMPTYRSTLFWFSLDDRCVPAKIDRNFGRRGNYNTG
jgi:hypothetical protein